MKDWMLWMTTIFMPLNDIREKIIIEKAYLVVEERMPQCLLDFATHLVAYAAQKAEQTNLLHTVVWWIFHKIFGNKPSRWCERSRDPYHRRAPSRRRGSRQAFPDAQCRFSLVDGVEMQPWRAITQKRFTETRDHASAEIEQRRLVILELLEPQANPAR